MDEKKLTALEEKIIWDYVRVALGSLPPDLNPDGFVVRALFMAQAKALVQVLRTIKREEEANDH